MGRGEQVASCRLQVAGYRVQVTSLIISKSIAAGFSRRQLITSYKLQFTGYREQVASYNGRNVCKCGF